MYFKNFEQFKNSTLYSYLSWFNASLTALRVIFFNLASVSTSIQISLLMSVILYPYILL